MNLTLREPLLLPLHSHSELTRHPGAYCPCISASHGIHQRLSRLQHQWGRHQRISTLPITHRPHPLTTQRAMETRMDSSPNRHSDNEPQLGLENVQLRSYQYEMLQKTMRGNTILAVREIWFLPVIGDWHLSDGYRLWQNLHVYTLVKPSGRLDLI